MQAAPSISTYLADVEAILSTAFAAPNRTHAESRDFYRAKAMTMLRTFTVPRRNLRRTWGNGLGVGTFLADKLAPPSAYHIGQILQARAKAQGFARLARAEGVVASRKAA